MMGAMIIPLPCLPLLMACHSGALIRKKTNHHGDADDFSVLRAFIGALNDMNDTLDADFPTWLATHVDVDRLRSYLVVSNFIANWDSYPQRPKNFWLYQDLRADKVVMGIRAVHLEHGLTNDYLPEVMTDRTIIEMAPELIVVADHTKFGKVASAYIAPVERITTLVTDSSADSEILAHLQEMGIRTIVAQEGGTDQ